MRIHWRSAPLIVGVNIKKIFFKNRTLYAPTYLALQSDLEDGTKFAVKKASTRSETSRGKRKALVENEDFAMEQRWLVQYLGKPINVDSIPRLIMH